MDLKNYLCKKYGVDSVDDLVKSYKDSNFVFILNEINNILDDNYIEVSNINSYSDTIQISEDVESFSVKIPKNVLESGYSSVLQYIKEEIIEIYESMPYEDFYSNCDSFSVVDENCIDSWKDVKTSLQDLIPESLVYKLYYSIEKYKNI